MPFLAALAAALLLAPALPAAAPAELAVGPAGETERFSCRRAGYNPPNLCRFPALLQLETGLALPGPPLAAPPPEYEGGSVFRLWSIGAEPGLLLTEPECAGPAYLFAIPWGPHLPGSFNYYHMTVDVLLPLFQLWEGEPRGLDHPRLLVPTVAAVRWPRPQEGVRGADWDAAAAWADPEAPWMQMLRAMSPLEPRPATRGPGWRAGACLRDVTAGVPSWRGHRGLALRFAAFVRSRVGVPPTPEPVTEFRRVGIVSRGDARRRRVLNEPELAAAARAAGFEVELLRFAGLSFAEQVAAVQPFDVLAGMQGAGMTNALYARPGAAVVLLFQLGADADPFRELLEPLPGPYVTWVNADAGRSVCSAADEEFCDQADTWVGEEEFVGLLSGLGVLG